ncbi:MAG: hypothetical protein AB7T10_02870 [bacterium]
MKKNAKRQMFQLIFTLLCSSVIIFSCSQNLSDGQDEYSHDYEDVADEDDGLLVGGARIDIRADTITANTPRGVLIKRGEFIWEKITRTKYVHYADRIIDDIDRVYEYDCSGFLYSIIIYDALPNHADNLLSWKMKLHPKDFSVRACTFYDYFRDSILGANTVTENAYWRVFTSIDSLKKGDLIIVRYDDDWRDEWIDSTGHASTGHVMIAWDIKAVNANNEVEIQVYDCASSGHTVSADTRYCNSIPVAEINEDSGKPSGIGFGWMKYKISTTVDRRPFAYKWSLNSTHWYNLYNGDEINEPGIKYDRIKGIIFARPI